MVNDKYVVKYLDPRTGKYEYATVKDVGDLQKLNTKVKTSIVDAINSISADDIEGLKNSLATIGETVKSLEDGTLELGDFQSIDDVVSREIEDAINSLKLENSGLLKLTQEEIDTIVSNAESEYRDSIAASVRALETSKADLEAAQAKMTSIGQMLENADIDYSNLTQVVDDINLYIEDVVKKTDFDMVNGIVSDYKTAVTQTEDGWGVDASRNMLSYLTGRVKSNETSLDVQHGLIQAKVGKDEFQYMTVDNLPAGKENMLHNTSDLRDWNFSSAFIFKSADDYRFTSIVQSDNAGENIIGTTDELEQGVTYAISTYVNVQNKNKEPNEEKYAITDGNYTATVVIDGDTIELNNVVEDNSSINGWKRVSGTFVAKRTAQQDIKFYVTSFNHDTQVGYLSAPKLEKGSSATSWIPHIEDNVSTILSQNAVMRVLSDRITSSVEEVRETKDAFETATSTFDQMADGFELNTNKLSEVLDKYGEVTGVQTQQASELEVLNTAITSKVWKQDIDTSIDTINIDTSNRIVNSAFNIYSYDEQTGALKLDYWDSNTGFAIKKHSQSLDNYLYATRSNATSVNPISIESSPFALRDGEKILFNFESLAVGNPLDNDNIFTLEMYDNNDIRVGLQDFKLSELKKEFLTSYDIGDSYKYNGTYIVKNSSVVKGTITLKLPKNGELWITKIMLQNAGIGTIGWTPSSVDNQIIQSKLSTEINQLADSIELVSNDERLDAISGLLVKKDGKITISPEAIVSRVTSQELGDKALISQTTLTQTEESLRFDLVDKEGVIQTINASSEGLLIDFDKVQIDGELIARMISAQSIDATQGFRLTDNNGNTLLEVVNDNGTPTLSITKELRVKFGEVNDKLDVTIVGVMEEYYYSVDKDEPLGGIWTPTPNAFEGGENRFVWKRTKIIYQSGDVNYHPSETGVNITGSWEYEKESVAAEVTKALDSAETAKELAVSEANQAMIDANKYADEQDALIQQQVTSSVDTAISTAEDAKQAAIDNYNNAVSEAERLVSEQTKTFDTKFGEIEDSVDTFNQSVADVDAKADANAKLLTTHQDLLDTINDISIPNVMSEAESALSSAGAAMAEALKTDGKIATLKESIEGTISDVNETAQSALTEANKTDGKIATLKESISKDVKSASDTASTALSKANTIDTKISNVNTTITDLDTKLSNSISTTSQSLTNQIGSASSKAQQALDEANKADGKIADYATRNNLISSAQADSKISDYVTRNGLVSGTTVDSKINTATGEINQNISKVEGKIDGLQVGGRNLFAISEVPVHSRLEKSGNKLTFINSYANNLGIKLGNILEVGKEYTISFKVKLISGEENSPGISGSIRFYDHLGESPVKQFGGRGAETISETFVLDSISDSYTIYFYGSSTGVYELKDIKIEKGNIATDWTPAPEDIYTQEEFKIFEANYNSSVEGINAKLGTVENKVDDNGRAFTEFKENEYSRTASEAKDAFTSVNKMIDENGNATEDFSKAVYEKNSERQKASFNEATKDLVRSATYEAGIDGINSSLREVEGKIPTEIGGRNLILETEEPLTIVGNGQVNNYKRKYKPYNDLETENPLTMSLEYEITGINENELPPNFQIVVEGFPGWHKFIVTKGNGLTGRLKETSTISSSRSGVTTFQFRADYLPSQATIKFSKIKLERGNIATDWTPAPEDIYTQSEFKVFEADYSQNVEGITSRLSTVENSKVDNNTYTDFYENEYKRTAKDATDAFTAVNKIVSEDGAVKDVFSKAVYEQNASRQSADFNEVTKDLVKTATYESGIDGVKEIITSVEGKVDGLQVGGRNYLKRSDLSTDAKILAGGGVFDFSRNSTDVTPLFSNLKLEKGKYIYHIMMKKPVGDSVAGIRFHKNNVTVNYYGKDQELDGEWNRIEIPFEVTNESDIYGSQIYNHAFGANFATTVEVMHPMIERGTIATDWSPAPEDNLSDSEFRTFESEYSRNSKEITERLSTVENSKLDGSTYTDFYENSYKKTAKDATDAYTAVNRIIDSDGKSTENFARAVYERNAQRQKSDFESATEGLLKTATYEAGIDGIKNSLSEVEGKIPTSVGGRNYLLNSGKPTPLTINSNNGSVYPITKGVEDGVDWFYQTHVDGTDIFIISTYVGEFYTNKSYFGKRFSKDLEDYDGIITYSVDVMSPEPVTLRLNLSSAGRDNQTTLVPNQWTRLVTTMPFTQEIRPMAFMADASSNTGIPAGTKLYWKNYKIEKGNIATDYSLAPEDTLLESDFKSFQADYEQNAQGITSRLSTAENNITTNNTAFTTFKENDYKRTAERVSDTFTKQETTTMLGGKADASQLSNYLAKSTYERDAEQSKERFETIESDLDNISVGSRNYAYKDSLKNNSLSLFNMDDYPSIYIRPKENVITAGIKISDTLFEVGETYTLSFTIQNLEDGEEIYHLGGHSNGFESLSVSMDGVEYNNQWSSAPIKTNLGHDEHKVIVKLKFTGMSGDSNLYIQPNRGGTVFKNYHALIKNINITKGTVATDWSPAVEDMANLSYVNSEITKSAEAIKTSLTNYAKTTDLNGLATETYADNIAVSEAGKVKNELTKYAKTTDLTGLATESYAQTQATTEAGKVEQKLSNYAKSSDLTGLATETYATNKAVSEAGKVSSELTKYELKTGVDSKLSSMASALRTETAEGMKTVYTKTETETLLGKKADSSALNNYVQQATYESGIDGVSQSLTRVEGKVDGLQVGGRNLFRNSNFVDELKFWQWNGQVTRVRVDGNDAILLTGTNQGFFQIPTQLEDDGVYTISFKAKSVGDSSQVRFGFLNQPTGNSTTTLIGNTWKKYSFTTNGDFDTSSNTLVHFYAFRDTAEGVYITDLKIEKGTIATDWTPAPEDTLTQDEYKAFKSDYESTVEGITGQITSLSESKLDGNTYTNFLANDYKATAEKATSAFTKVDKVVDASGNVKDDFSKAVYEQNATRQTASFNEVTKDLVTTATYTSGIKGVTDSITSVRGDLDNLSVGGRNLVLNSSVLEASGLGAVSGSRAEYRTINTGQSYMDLEDGEIITISFDIEMKIATKNPKLQVYNSNRPGRVGIVAVTVAEQLQGDVGEVINKRVSLTTRATLRDSPSYSYNTLEFYSTYGTDNFYKISKLKVERGNVATDWSPAPEDMLGQADFQVFKNTYESNDQAIQNRLTAIDSGADGSILYNTNLALETAQGNTRSITTLDTKVDNLKVGGRNLITGSDKVYTRTNTPNISVDGINIDGLVGGEEYTFSFDIRSTTATYISSLFINSSINLLIPNSPISNEWTRLSATFKWIEGSNYGGFDLRPHFYPKDDYSGTHEVKNLKLEKGTIPTDWTPAPEDMLGKETFTLFKNDYDETSKGILSRLTAIDSSEEGSVVTRLNKTESTANGNSKLITTINNNYVTQKNINESILSDKQIKDTRNDNQLPSWYMKNYPKQQVKEFKNITVMGLKTNTSGTYGVLTTDVQWGDATGGTVKQQFVTNDATYIRTGNNDGTLWEEWVTQVNTADSTYQKVIETSDMYQRVVGEGDGELTYSKNRRLGSKSQSIEKNSTAKIQHNGDGFEVGKTYTLSFDVSCLLGDVVEWIERDRTDVLPFKRITKEDNTILAKDSYIERNGVNGNVTYQWTVETVNGVETGNRTDEVIVRRVEPVDEIYVKGTNTNSTVNFTINKVDSEQTEEPKAKVVMLGDSITMGYGRNIKIPNIVSQEIERSVQNAGYGSTTAALHPSKPEIRKIGFTKLVDSITSGNWSEALNANLSGVTYATPTAYKQSLTDLSKINFNDIESVIIMYGTNDWAMDVKLDNANDMYDQSTYLGALRYGVNKLQQAYPHLEILVSQPILWTMGAMNSENYNNGIGLKVKDYANALNDSLNMGTPIAQVYNRGITTSNYGQYFPSNDGTHPNDDGNSVIGKLMASEFTRVFSTDKASVVNFSISKEDSKTSTVTLNFLT